MRRYLPFVIVAVVALLAVGGGTFLYRTKRAANPAPKISKTETERPGEIVHVLGPANATVTVEEFADFQCPPCGNLSEPINQLQKHYNLRVIYREFPLAMHNHAKEAAYAAEGAARQGRFWQMHDLLYREQAVWSKSTDARTLFSAYAGMLHLDRGRVQDDRDSSHVQQRVENDQQRGAESGVRTAPTIFLQDKLV